MGGKKRKKGEVEVVGEASLTSLRGFEKISHCVEFRMSGKSKVYIGEQLCSFDTSDHHLPTWFIVDH